MLKGELFGPGNAQLPAPPMLMIDRITEISEDSGPDGKGHVVAEFNITPDLWFLSAISRTIQLCQAALAWMHYGN